MIDRDDDGIRRLVARLSRPHPAGGKVIERAAILAEGADSAAVVAWILEHAGEPEVIAPPRSGRGLHAARNDAGRATLRYVFPPGALT